MTCATATCRFPAGSSSTRIARPRSAESIRAKFSVVARYATTNDAVPLIWCAVENSAWPCGGPMIENRCSVVIP